MTRIWRLLLLIISIILADQLSKGAIQSNLIYGESIPVISGFFSITYVKNQGAAFGMGANASQWFRSLFFLFLPVVACFWLAWLAWTSRKTNLRLFIAYGLILAGAIGNLIDRFSLGYVVDFLDFYIKDSHFPAFNVADSSITIAGFLLVIDFFFEIKKNKVNGNMMTDLGQK